MPAEELTPDNGNGKGEGESDPIEPGDAELDKGVFRSLQRDAKEDPSKTDRVKGYADEYPGVVEDTGNGNEQDSDDT